MKEVCSFDGAFQVHSVEPVQDCKRAMFIVQGVLTYMRAEDIEVSNLLDMEYSHGGVLAYFPGLANLAHAYSKPLVDVLRPTAAHTSLSDWDS